MLVNRHPDRLCRRRVSTGDGIAHINRRLQNRIGRTAAQKGRSAARIGSIGYPSRRGRDRTNVKKSRTSWRRSRSVPKLNTGWHRTHRRGKGTQSCAHLHAVIWAALRLLASRRSRYHWFGQGWGIVQGLNVGQRKPAPRPPALPEPPEPLQPLALPRSPESAASRSPSPNRGCHWNYREPHCPAERRLTLQHQHQPVAFCIFP